MVTLSQHECRVLGTMIEKAQTTPAQYPLSLNSLMVGCNQKNNRDPVTNLSEEQVYDAVDSLRAKSLVREAMLSGSRVSKFRHIARETLAASTEELVLLAELWLRGSQSLGELRANASRMHPLDSTDSVRAILVAMASRPQPYVKEQPTRPGERAPRWTQLLCPDAHPEVRMPASGLEPAHPGVPDELAERVQRLEREFRELKLSVDRLVSALGGAADRSGGAA